MGMRPWSPTPIDGGQVDRNLSDGARVAADLGKQSMAQGFLAFGVKRMAEAGALSHTDPVVAWMGPASSTLRLPRAAAAGGQMAILLIVCNATGSTVTVAAQNGEKVSGGTSVVVAANSFTLFVSDGASRWV